ncbi:MAG: hypothetical protein P4L90_21530 [Rhodopila sp.]|nr:hypothetical protein [Rhodopila sp.]
MLDNDVATVMELSDAELDMVAAGAALNLNLNLSHLVNLNVGFALQNGQNVNVLSIGSVQNINQIIGIGQIA